MEVISREDAKARGLKRYYTGVPCSHGHDAERLVVSYDCCTCLSDRKSAQRKKNPERDQNRSKRYYYLNREDRIEYAAKRIAENPQANREKVRKWKKENPGKVAAQKKGRELAKTGATPKWLTREHHKQIAAIYLQAQVWSEATGVPYHVDHIIPLNGENVCGLHVPWNLRAIKGEENLKKSNKMEEDAWG
jgi:hypothetical protein